MVRGGFSNYSAEGLIITFVAGVRNLSWNYRRKCDNIKENKQE